MASESEIAWAAGLFEGEGSISLLDPARYPSGSDATRRKPWVAMSVTSTDRDVLERFHEIVGVGGVSFAHRGARPHHKDCWSWQLGARDKVEQLLRAFLPWFGSRRTAKALEALALIEGHRDYRECAYCGERFETYRSTQRFCCRDHQYRAWYEKAKAEHLKDYHRSYYLANREAALERARRQRERNKSSK